MQRMSETLEFPKPSSESVTAFVNTETRERWEVNMVTRVTVGRAEDNTLSLKDDVYASGHHAEIYFEGGVCHVKDLDSRNGTYKNNEMISGAVPVQPGDLITFGRTKFEVQ